MAWYDDPELRKEKLDRDIFMFQYEKHYNYLNQFPIFYTYSESMTPEYMMYPCVADILDARKHEKTTDNAKRN